MRRMDKTKRRRLNVKRAVLCGTITIALISAGFYFLYPQEKDEEVYSIQKEQQENDLEVAQETKQTASIQATIENSQESLSQSKQIDTNNKQETDPEAVPEAKQITSTSVKATKEDNQKSLNQAKQIDTTKKKPEKNVEKPLTSNPVAKAEPSAEPDDSAEKLAGRETPSRYKLGQAGKHSDLKFSIDKVDNQYERGVLTVTGKISSNDQRIIVRVSDEYGYILPGEMKVVGKSGDMFAVEAEIFLPGCHIFEAKYVVLNTLSIERRLTKIAEYEL